MKYGYNNIPKKELIKNYKSSDDKIEITYLDGSKKVFPLTEEIKKSIISKMLLQAQERKNSKTLEKAMKEKKELLLNIIGEVGVLALSLASYQMYNTDNIATLIGFFGGLTGLVIVREGIDYKFNADEIKELKKYDIYLSIREKLKNKKEQKLTINTLDNFSLNDLEEIQTNLNSTQNGPVLTKKVGK